MQTQHLHLETRRGPEQLKIIQVSIKSIKNPLSTIESRSVLIVKKNQTLTSPCRAAADIYSPALRPTSCCNTLTGQFLFARIIRFKLSQCLPGSFGQVNPEANFHFEGFHGLEKHGGAEPVGRRYLVVISFIKRGFEGQEPRIFPM